MDWKASMAPSSITSTETRGQLSNLMFSTGRRRERSGCKPRLVQVSDISLVICVRAHERNPWVLNRLGAISELYDELPKVVIVDFGSDDNYSKDIQGVCQENGFRYVYVDDRDVYSASKARNCGFEACETEYIFFTDIDFVYVSNFFSKLAELLSQSVKEGQIDGIFMCSAVHLSESSTEEYVSMDASERSSFLAQLGLRMNYSGFGEDVQFVAPYSNNFLIHRDLFSLSGGYHEGFRGHGSEDFEFISRLNKYTQHFPMPTDPEKDFGGPLRQEFFDQQGYQGFRALNSVTCLAGENHGLKAFHLYHPTSNDDEWRSSNDWRRDRLIKIMNSYLSDQRMLLKTDSIHRAKRALCVCKQEDHWGYFAPLRLLGYSLDVIEEATPEALAAATEGILNGSYDALAVFNPYMKSHAAFKALFLLAKDKRSTIVIERGALPGTIYYASDVAYAAPEYADKAFANFSASTKALERAGAYMATLRLGQLTLEDVDAYEVTAMKHAALRGISRKKIFIPLQLPEDMAVTMFVRNAQSYADFQDSVAQLGAFEDVTFLIKPHPLSKLDLAAVPTNVVILDRRDNVHAIVDMVDAVVCYNSGVALLSMAHEKPVYTVGNAYFNKGGAGRWAASLEAAVSDFLLMPWAPDRRAIQSVFAWLDQLYSRFSAVDDVKEFAARKAHGYRDVVVEHIRFDGVSVPMGRIMEGRQRTPNSYAMGRLNYSTTQEEDVNSSADKYERWARNDFRAGRFEASASNFRLAFEERDSQPVNLLRCAAEAHLRAGQRAQAIAALQAAYSMRSGNKAIRKRLMAARRPILGRLLGSKPFPVEPEAG